jgi:hypothetical protein
MSTEAPSPNTSHSSAIAIASQDIDAKLTRHIEHRYLFCPNLGQLGADSFHHLPGDDYQPNDIGTNNVPASPASPASYKLSLIKTDTTDGPTDQSSYALTTFQELFSRRGVKR